MGDMGEGFMEPPKSRLEPSSEARALDCTETLPEPNFYVNSSSC